MPQWLLWWENFVGWPSQTWCWKASQTFPSTRQEYTTWNTICGDVFTLPWQQSGGGCVMGGGFYDSRGGEEAVTMSLWRGRKSAHLFMWKANRSVIREQGYYWDMTVAQSIFLSFLIFLSFGRGRTNCMFSHLTWVCPLWWTFITVTPWFSKVLLDQDLNKSVLGQIVHGKNVSVSNKTSGVNSLPDNSIMLLPIWPVTCLSGNKKSGFGF